MTTLPSLPPQVVIGTAGHVDHGKTALVRALTGVDTDRLPEEKRRGLTIELGYAFALGEEHDQQCDLGFIDCPGHHRFVRQAIAGIGAMRGCLLVIAADEGISAQTVEHADLIRLLGIRFGRVVISKSDLVDEATAAARAAEASSLMAGTPLADLPPLIVSAHTGAGVAELRSWLFTAGQNHLSHDLEEPARLAIDRVFTIAGHGTVVTGTLLSGSLRVGQQLDLVPGGSVRLRGIQVRGQDCHEAHAGQRTACNIVGVDRPDIHRGSWLAEAGSLHPTSTLDVQLRPCGDGIHHGMLVTVHHATAVTQARLSLYEQDHLATGVGIGQLRLQEPLPVANSDLLILRRTSPPDTLGGARVLAVEAPRHKRFRDTTRRWFDALLGNHGQRLVSWLELRSPLPALVEEAERWIGGRTRLRQARSQAGDLVLERHVAGSTWLWSNAGWHRLGNHITDWLQNRLRFDHLWFAGDRMRLDVAADLPDTLWWDHLQALAQAGRVLIHGRQVALPQRGPALPSAVAADVTAVLDAYEAAGLRPPYDHPLCDSLGERDRFMRAIACAREYGQLIALNDRQHLHRTHAEHLVRHVQPAGRAGGGHHHGVVQDHLRPHPQTRHSDRRME